jgi:4-carboxymuconolactone decarboxylase
MIDRMPPLDEAAMTEPQRKAAAALIAGPRKAVAGPFIAFLRSPELMDRMQRVGEYLRFDNSIPQRLSELAMLITARHVTNQFEWAIHHPLALKAGVARATLDAVEMRARPEAMAEDEAVLHDFVVELLRTNAVSDATYARALEQFGETGIVDLIATVGYFVTVCLVMNVAGTPAPATDVKPLK